MDITIVLFYLFAAVIVVSGLMMVRSTNLVHSALYMIATFLGVAGTYLLLNADFIAAVQIIVYVGSISIMMVFGVMLTRRGNICDSNLPNKYKIASAIVALIFFAVIVRFVTLTEWRQVVNAKLQNTVPQISNLFLNDYLIAFEAAALLLLVALIGAVIIGKGLRRSE